MEKHSTFWPAGCHWDGFWEVRPLTPSHYLLITVAAVSVFRKSWGWKGAEMLDVDELSDGGPHQDLLLAWRSKDYRSMVGLMSTEVFTWVSVSSMRTQTLLFDWSCDEAQLSDWAAKVTIFYSYEQIQVDYSGRSIIPKLISRGQWNLQSSL